MVVIRVALIFSTLCHEKHLLLVSDPSNLINFGFLFSLSMNILHAKCYCANGKTEFADEENTDRFFFITGYVYKPGTKLQCSRSKTFHRIPCVWHKSV